MLFSSIASTSYRHCHNHPIFLWENENGLLWSMDRDENAPAKFVGWWTNLSPIINLIRSLFWAGAKFFSKKIMAINFLVSSNSRKLAVVIDPSSVSQFLGIIKEQVFHFFFFWNESFPILEILKWSGSGFCVANSQFLIANQGAGPPNPDLWDI